MDPRHPELALPRVKELIKQYEDLEKRISKATVSNDLGQLEREGVLVVQELCLVAPRLHETLMNTSRNRRADLSRGSIYDQMREYAATAERVEEPVEEKKPAKKKPAKKGKK